MLFLGKSAWTGIIFILLTTGFSASRPTPLASGNRFSKALTAVGDPDAIKTMQQTLLSRGHYSGTVDGVLGLRTRASIRAYQKAQNLPITGQLDAQTADKLGVNPGEREQAGGDAAKGKPSAGTKLVKSSGRANKAPRKEVKAATAPESSEQGTRD